MSLESQEDFKNSAFEETQPVLADYVEKEQLLRVVAKKHIRSNNSISSEAYRPRKRLEATTGFEKNVSTNLKSCHSDDEALKKYLSRFNRSVLYEICASKPNQRGYPCIKDKTCHVGITGDMAILFEDMETLEFLATESTRCYPND